MRLPGYLIAFFLTVLLASTTPVGTGTGTHQFDLLHPLFTHVHLVNGRVLTHEQLAQAQAVPTSTPRPTGGQAIGSGTADNGVDAGTGLSPIVPGHTLRLGLAMPVRFVSDDMVMPASNEEAPPDPPPL